HAKNNYGALHKMINIMEEDLNAILERNWEVEAFNGFFFVFCLCITNFEEIKEYRPEDDLESDLMMQMWRWLKTATDSTRVKTAESIPLT
ncbi:hypothetical protein ACJX0J_007445, partial [Zea mays]